jgi:predicted CopG family antitoxin
MSKRVALSEQAYETLVAHKRGTTDSLSQIILRFVPPPIRTLRDLEKHLSNLHGPVIADPAVSARLGGKPHARKRHRQAFSPNRPL